MSQRTAIHVFLLRAVPRICAAVAIILAVSSRAWLVNVPRELHGGLLSFDSGGDLWGNAELVAAARENGSQIVSGLYAPAGQLTFGFGLLAVAFLIATVLTSARWARNGALVAHGIGIATGVLFLVTKPTGPAFGTDPGWSAVVFISAAALGVLLNIRPRGGARR